jgi:1,4-alpha-glucan branching enzyme
MSTLIKSKSITVRLQFHDDQAKSVCIAGTFNDWHPKLTPMVTSGSGQWSQELALSPGIYEYQYVVDGRWINDPQAVKSTPNPFGGRNSVLIVEQDNMKAVANHGRPSAFMKPSEKRRRS